LKPSKNWTRFGIDIPGLLGEAVVRPTVAGLEQGVVKQLAFVLAEDCELVLPAGGANGGLSVGVGRSANEIKRSYRKTREA
jgi:hypothetical protein